MYYQVRALTGPGSPPVPCSTNGNFTVSCPATTYTLSGTVYSDANANGTIDPTEGLPGIVLIVYNDNNANGIFDTGDTPFSTVTTDPNGMYFVNVPSGEYVIVVSSVTSGYAMPTNNNFAAAVGAGNLTLNIPLSLIIGISEIETNSFNSYFSNATDLIINIDFEKSQKINLSMMDANGKTVFTKSENIIIGKNNFSIDTKGLSSGIYFINIIKENGALITKKIVKN